MSVMRKISIVIPVYNTEKYLKLSVDSVLSQSYQDWELILVDDGSKDGSGAICDKYASEDSRIKVYHTVNQGVTAARGYGVEQSTGEWICFLDADDTLADDALQVMLGKSADCDIVIGNKRIVSGNDVTEEWMNQDDRQLQAVEFLDGLIRNKISQYITGRIFRRILFDNGTICIPRELIMAEDFIMNVQLGNKAKKIAVIRDMVYGYHVYGESVSHTFRTNLEYESRFCDCLFSALKTGRYYEEVKEAFTFQKVRALKSAFMAQQGRVNLRHPFLQEVRKEAKSIGLSRGWKLFLYLLPLKYIGYIFFRSLNK